MRGRKDMPPGPGRPPGCRNKITRTMKESFLNVYDALGGEEWLLTVAKENELEFAKLLARLLPSSVHAEVANITEQPEDSLSDAELERIAICGAAEEAAEECNVRVVRRFSAASMSE